MVAEVLEMLLDCAVRLPADPFALGSSRTDVPAHLG